LKPVRAAPSFHEAEGLSGGSVVDRTFERAKFPRAQGAILRYLYDSGDEVVFMDEAFDQSRCRADVGRAAVQPPSSSVQVMFVGGSRRDRSRQASVVLR
jgi:translation elongation factor P/translation initiation factor 5A